MSDKDKQPKLNGYPEKPKIDWDKWMAEHHIKLKPGK